MSLELLRNLATVQYKSIIRIGRTHDSSMTEPDPPRKTAHGEGILTTIPPTDP